MASQMNSPIEDYYLRPNLTSLDRVVYYPGIFLPPFNVIFGVFALRVSCNDFKRLHKNFVLLRMCLVICFIFIAVGHFMICLTCILEGQIVPDRFYVYWYVGVRIAITGADSLRCFFVGIIVERLVATMNSKFYEKHGGFWISGLLILVAATIGITIMAAKLYVVASAATIFYCVGLGIDVIGCVCVYWLYRHNKKARKINTRSTIILSQRYQITENIRLLRILFPIVATGVFVSISGTFLHILSYNIPTLFEYFRYSVAMYYLLYNCYCFVSIILYASMDPYYRRQRWCFWQKVESVDVSSRVSERTTTMGQHVPIKNVDGEDVARMPTTDEYFKTIQQQWDVNNTSTKTGK